MKQNRKKNYVCPLVELEEAECCTSMMAVSGVISNNGIDYGGIDEDGDLEPSVKESRWDE